MNDLDKELEEHMLAAIYRGVSINKLDKIPEDSMNWFKATADGDVYGLVIDPTAIKQAFIDAGWFTPADKELVQEIVNHRLQQKIERVGFNPDAESYADRFPRVMTGQEWYDLFKREYLGRILPGKFHADDLTEEDVLECAKKAAGIK